MPVDELHAALNQAYRFEVPRALAEAVVASRGFDMWKAFGFEWEFQHGRRFRTFDDSYVGAVPEHFTFGRPGVDGLAYGFIVHAPELDMDELPVFKLDPVYGTIDAIAADFRTALLDLAAWHMAVHSDEGDEVGDGPSAYPAVAGALGFPAVPTSSRAWNAPFEFVPHVRPGWRFVQTEDGVGVLAPAKSFCADAIDVDRFRAQYCDRDDRFDLRRRGIDPFAGAEEMLDALVRACADALEAGYPGSALVGIRRTYLAMSAVTADTQRKLDVFSAWADANDALNRPLIADVLRDSIGDLRRALEAGARRRDPRR